MSARSRGHSIMSLPYRETFSTGFFTGFQLFSVIYLLPGLLEEMGDINSLDLTIFCAVILLTCSQLELGRRLSLLSSAAAMRDAVYMQSVAFLLFVLAPQFFWFVVAFITWLLSFCALQIAVGRWTLLAQDPEHRRLETNVSLIGILLGIASAKTIPYFEGSQETQIYAGLLVTGIVSFHMYLFARANTSYTSTGQMWMISDLRRDDPALALSALSAALGLMLGLMIFQRAQIGPAVLGGLVLVIAGKMLFTRWTPETAMRGSCYVAAAALIVDAVLAEGFTTSAYLMPLAAAVLYAAIRVGAYNPRTMMSTADRIALHGMGVMIGISLQGALAFTGMNTAQAFGSTAALLVITAYLVSFVPEEE
jgi:hypothetical protein